MRNFYCFAALIVLLLGISFSVSATQVTPASGQVTVLQSLLEGNGDLLSINPPNTTGLSVNRYSRFDVDKQLKIRNTPSFNPDTGEAIPPAKTIVIMTNGRGAQLTAKIEIVGPATDLVFINSSNSPSQAIRCYFCDFSNILHLSFISSKGDKYSSVTSSVGTITTEGEIEIDSLYAPGAVGLALVAEKIITQGEININQPAVRQKNGGYTAIAHGGYSLGTGGIDLVSGPFLWHYEERQIIRALNGSGTQTFTGNFFAPRVHLSVSTPIIFNGKIDTRTNVISVISYKGETHVPQEEVVIQALFKQESYYADNVEINGKVYSDNRAIFRATRDVVFHSGASISAPDIQVISVGEFSNASKLKNIENISVAAGEIINEGEIDVANQLDLYATGMIFNQYGGVLRGKDIILTSENYMVRNGSRTPYRDTYSYPHTSLYFYRSGYLDNGWDLESFEFSKDPADITQLGTYYLVPGGIAKTNNGNYEFPKKTTAHIIGDTIKIRASRFENINPYFEKFQFEGNTEIDRRRVAEVSVSAESLFEFADLPSNGSSTSSQAKYLINSSARIAVNSRSGKMKIDSERVINNRYRVETFLVPALSKEAAPPELVDYATDFSFEERAGFQSITGAYSPPGFMLSMAPVEIRATKFFANVLGYVEFFRGLQLKSPTLKSIGIQNQAFRDDWSEGQRVWANYLRSAGLLNDSPSDYVFLAPPNEREVLFHVSGDGQYDTLAASSAEGWFDVFNPFMYFVDKAIDDAIDNSPDENFLSTGPSYSDQLVREDVQSNNRIKDIAEAIADNTVVVSTSTTEEEYSVIEELENLYESLKSKFTNFINEFDWWGLAK